MRPFLCPSQLALMPRAGFDQVMHESRTWSRLMPRAGKSVSITFGEPINDAVEPLLEQYKKAFPVHWKPDTYAREVAEDLRDEPQGRLAGMRSRIAEVMRGELMEVGRRVEAMRKE